MLGLLVGAALRSVVLAAVVAMGLRLRRNRNQSPHVALTAWTLVLAASLALPVAMRVTSFALPRDIIAIWRLPVAPEPSTRIADLDVTDDDGPGMPVTAPPAGKPTVAIASFRDIAWALYLTVFGALMLRLLAGVALSWRIARAATPLREQWTADLDVRVSRRVTAPATFGSIILLPDDHTTWRPAKRQAVLAHEAAHVTRHDFAIQLAAAVNRAVFWFNPLSWWLRRHLSDLAETASDDAAIARLNDRPGYAEILLEVSGRVSRLPGAVSMARHADVAARIERILCESPLPAGTNLGDRAVLATCIVPPAVALCFLTITPERPPAPPPLAARAPAAVDILAEQAAAESAVPPTPSRTPTARNVTLAVAPPSPLAPTEVASAPITRAEPPAAADPRMKIALAPLPLPPPSFTPPAPPLPLTAARQMPRRMPHVMTRATVADAPSRASRQPSPTADDSQRTFDRPSATAVTNATGPHRSATNDPGLAPTIGARRTEAQSPVFASVANQTCSGTYSGESGTPPWLRPIQAHFYRGPGDAPRVTFYFSRQKPADLPVTIRGSEIKFATKDGTTYKLLPSPNMLLPPGYRRFTGSAEHPVVGTIEFACRELNLPL